MPSFDIVSSFDMQEIDNAVNMVVRDIANRYDFRGSSTNISLDKGDKSITILADNTMQLAAVVDMIKSRAIGRGVSLKVFKFHDEETAAGTSLRQKISMREGIDKDRAKKINKIDCDQIEELSHPIKDNFNLREDVVSEDINRESLQKTSNKTEDGFYLVPKVIE